MHMERYSGLFSLHNGYPEDENNITLTDLINHTIKQSQFNNVSCPGRGYSKDPYPPFGLTKPLRRSIEVKSLQILCCSVICLNTRLKNIDMLPLPNSVVERIYDTYVTYLYDI